MNKLFVNKSAIISIIIASLIVTSGTMYFVTAGKNDKVLAYDEISSDSKAKELTSSPNLATVADNTVLSDAEPTDGDAVAASNPVLTAPPVTEPFNTPTPAEPPPDFTEHSYYPVTTIPKYTVPYIEATSLPYSTFQHHPTYVPPDYFQDTSNCVQNPTYYTAILPKECSPTVSWDYVRSGDIASFKYSYNGLGGSEKIEFYAESNNKYFYNYVKSNNPEVLIEPSYYNELQNRSNNLTKNEFDYLALITDFFITRYNVRNWNNYIYPYNPTADSTCQDEFTLEIKYSDGSTIYAKAYGVRPSDYNSFIYSLKEAFFTLY